jgi:hypothetical protein
LSSLNYQFDESILLKIIDGKMTSDGNEDNKSETKELTSHTLATSATAAFQ